jgi:hypothetical protein
MAEWTGATSDTCSDPNEDRACSSADVGPELHSAEVGLERTDVGQESASDPIVRRANRLLPSGTFEIGNNHPDSRYLGHALFDAGREFIVVKPVVEGRRTSFLHRRRERLESNETLLVTVSLEGERLGEQRRIPMSYWTHDPSSSDESEDYSTLGSGVPTFTMHDGMLARLHACFAVCQ